MHNGTCPGGCGYVDEMNAQLHGFDGDAAVYNGYISPVRLGHLGDANFIFMFQFQFVFFITWKLDLPEDTCS